MIIYFRVCEKQETMSFTRRWKNISKTDIIKKSWASLVKSINSQDKVKIFEDDCSSELLEWLRKTSTTNNIEILSIPKHKKARTEYPLHCIFPYQELMNKDAVNNPNEIIYFSNDDFLYLPNALNLMRTVYEDGWDSFATTYDYPDRYTLDKTRNCEVFINRGSHWRTIPSCTGVTMAKGSMWLKHKTTITQHAAFNSDAYTWEVYGKEKAICPIPGQSTHLTEGCMTPLINWEAVWEATTII